MATFLKVGFILVIIAHLFLAVGYGLDWGVPTKSSTVFDQLMIAWLFGVMYFNVHNTEKRRGN